MKYPKRSQYKYAKSRYEVQNWRRYEAGLRKRGDLTVWLSDDALDSWRAPPSGESGGQRTYSNIAIEVAPTLRMVFHLPLRQTEGFLRSLAHMLEVEEVVERPGSDTDHRLSMFLSAQGRIDERVTLDVTTFAQPRWTDFGDLRAIVSASMKIQVVGRLSILVSSRVLHDTEPPDRVEDTDWNTKTGLVWSL